MGVSKFLYVLLLLVLSVSVTCSYRQCVQEFQELAARIETKKIECEAVKENMAREYERMLNSLIQEQRLEMEELTTEHMNERENLKETYEQQD